jgi:hypothetical protein
MAFQYLLDVFASDANQRHVLRALKDALAGSSERAIAAICWLIRALLTSVTPPPPSIASP